MEAFLAKDPTLKDTAQRAFVSYVKSVVLMKNKKVFDAQSLDTNTFANSLGLAIPPRIRFLQRYNARTGKNVPTSASNKKIYFSDDGDEEKKADKVEASDSGVSDPEDNGYDESTPFHVSEDSDSDDGMLKVKREDHDIELPSNFEIEENLNSMKKKSKKPITKAAVVRKILKKKIVTNQKIVFSEDGQGTTVGGSSKDKKSDLAQEYENEDKGGIDIEKAKLVLKEEDKFDKQMFKEKVKAKHKEEKRKLKAEKLRKEEEQDEFGEDSESEAEPDLSWLPDPNKIYGDKNIDDVDNFEDFKKMESEDEQEKKKKKKRKVKSEGAADEPSTKKRKQKKIVEISNSMNVNEAEELALMLLKNK